MLYFFRPKQVRAELEARSALLGELGGDNAEDIGPLIEAVVWHDGTNWRAALDTTDIYAHDVPASPSAPAGAEPARGALAAFTPMTDYKVEHKYGTFSAGDCCNFAVNIYDGGAVLSVVVDAGPHGTHVAGIVAAHYPGKGGALDGVAPGE